MSYYAHQTYLEHTVQTSDPLELTRLLYRGAVDSLRGAIQALATGDIATRGRLITKAQQILVELAGTLDRDRGGELATNLARLYEYCLYLIQKGHFEQNAAPIEEARSLLQSLLEGWDRCALEASTPVGVSSAA